MERKIMKSTIIGKRNLSRFLAKMDHIYPRTLCKKHFGSLFAFYIQKLFTITKCYRTFCRYWENNNRDLVTTSLFRKPIYFKGAGNRKAFLCKSLKICCLLDTAYDRMHTEKDFWAESHTKKLTTKFADRDSNLEIPNLWILGSQRLLVPVLSNKMISNFEAYSAHHLCCIYV